MLYLKYAIIGIVILLIQNVHSLCSATHGVIYFEDHGNGAWHACGVCQDMIPPHYNTLTLMGYWCESCTTGACNAGKYRASCSASSDSYCTDCSTGGSCSASQFRGQCNGQGATTNDCVSCTNSGTCNAGTYRGTCNGGGGTTNVCVSCSSPTCGRGTYRTQCVNGATQNPCNACSPANCATNSYTVLCSTSTTNTCAQCVRSTVCELGYFLSACNPTATIDTGACTQCASQTCIGNTRRVKCSGTQVQNQCVVCTTSNCLEGTYHSTCNGLTESDSECKQCDDSIKCVSGTYKIKCTGTGGQESTCKLCPADSSSPPESDSINECQCNAGYTVDSETQCTACASGKYKTSTIECTDCEPGKQYSGKAGADFMVCQSCTPGKYAASAGSFTCVDCEVGYYQNESAQMSCKLCDEGKYQDIKGSSACLSCASGKTLAFKGGDSVSLCSQCGMGKFSGPGASECEVCPENQNSTIGSSICLLCAAGKYWDNVLCLECRDGTYKNTEGSSECLICSHGRALTEKWQECSFLPHCLESYYYHMTTCTRCPNNHTSTVTGIAANSTITRTSCVCIAGYEHSGNEMCKACLPGSYSPVYNSTCRPCAPGSFSITSGQTVCTLCPLNWVSVSSGSSSCVPCPSGSVSNKHRQICLPHSIEYTYTTDINAYEVRFFCVDAMKFGLQGLSFRMQKKIGEEWSELDIQSIQSYSPNLLDSNTAFVLGNICLDTFLHQKPVNCPINMFAMRLHSYIWDCMPCPTSTYKTTNTLLFSDCVVCGTNGVNTCPELEKKCMVASDLIVSQTASLLYTNFMKIV